MEALVKKGKIRSIGVSNFTREKIEDLWDKAEIKPAVNQIEAHPYLQQPDLLAWSKEKVSPVDPGGKNLRCCIPVVGSLIYVEMQGIVVTAYSPLANNIYNLPR